ncbi:MAG: CaiB/BaiF CoA transferase family protein, partial [Burkholderiales bacterium]
MTRAYDGLKVLDFTAMIAGPHCTRLLADLGADVIKLEPPEGDYMRSRGPLRDGHSTYYGSLNCGKKSLCVDLKKPQARELVLELAAQADVVVENFRPGVMQRLGFGHAALSALNPRLVYCSISGYGQSGSLADRPAYAPIVHAASGFDMAMLHYQDGLSRPLQSGIFIADILSGVNAFGGIGAALYRRE